MINYESHDEIFKCCTLGIKETKYYDSQAILGVVELSDTWTAPLQGKLWQTLADISELHVAQWCQGATPSGSVITPGAAICRNHCRWHIVAMHLHKM